MSAPQDRFSESAARLFGQCALMMGWRPDEFWTATPAEVASIFAAYTAPQDAARISRDELNRLLEQDNG